MKMVGELRTGVFLNAIQRGHELRLAAGSVHSPVYIMMTKLQRYQCLGQGQEARFVEMQGVHQ